MSGKRIWTMVALALAIGACATDHDTKPTEFSAMIPAPQVPTIPARPVGDSDQKMYLDLDLSASPLRVKSRAADKPEYRGLYMPDGMTDVTGRLWIGPNIGLELGTALGSGRTRPLSRGDAYDNPGPTFRFPLGASIVTPGIRNAAGREWLWFGIQPRIAYEHMSMEHNGSTEEDPPHTWVAECSMWTSVGISEDWTAFGGLRLWTTHEVDVEKWEEEQNPELKSVGGAPLWFAGLQYDHRGERIGWRLQARGYLAADGNTEQGVDYGPAASLSVAVLFLGGVSNHAPKQEPSPVYEPEPEVPVEVPHPEYPGKGPRYIPPH